MVVNSTLGEVALASAYHVIMLFHSPCVFLIGLAMDMFTKRPITPHTPSVEDIPNRKMLRIAEKYVGCPKRL
jgi:hypothetical protein